MMDDSNKDAWQEDDRPPIFSNWNHFYIVVLVIHALIITLFYIFTHAYS